MKKFTKIIALVLVSAMLALLFVGCGSGSGSSNSIVGKWEIKEEAEGMSVSMVFEFKANGDLAMTSEMNGSELASQKGTYKVDGDQITVTLEGEDPETSTFSISGDKLTISDGGSEIVLTRK